MCLAEGLLWCTGVCGVSDYEDEDEDEDGVGPFGDTALSPGHPSPQQTQHRDTHIYRYKQTKSPLPQCCTRSQTQMAPLHPCQTVYPQQQQHRLLPQQPLLQSVLVLVTDQVLCPQLFLVLLLLRKLHQLHLQ